ELLAHSVGQGLDIRWYEVVDGNGDAVPPETGHEIGGLLDRFRPAVVGRDGVDPAGPARADDSRGGLAEGCGDASSGAPRCSGDDRYAATQAFGTGPRGHRSDISGSSEGLSVRNPPRPIVRSK